MQVTQARLHELLNYDPETGVFTWKVDVGSRAQKGQRAGTVRKNDGYRQIKVDGKYVLEHRLAWMHVYGEDVPSHVDHINQIKVDNRIENLRAATNSQNLHNSKVWKSNTSGAKGVCWCKTTDKWRSLIRVGGKRICLGRFDCIAAASFAYQIAADQHFGEFANHGKA